MQRSCRRWRFLCRVPLRPLSGAVGQLESEGRESTFWSLTEWGVVTSSWWLSLRTLIFSSHVSSAYGETQGEANLCSLDQYPITFTYLVVLRVREAHRTGPSKPRECECSIAALPATRRNVCWFYSTNQSNLPPHLTYQWFCLEKRGWFFFFGTCWMPLMWRGLYFSCMTPTRLTNEKHHVAIYWKKKRRTDKVNWFLLST